MAYSCEPCLELSVRQGAADAEGLGLSVRRVVLDARETKLQQVVLDEDGVLVARQVNDVARQVLDDVARQVLDDVARQVIDEPDHRGGQVQQKTGLAATSA